MVESLTAILSIIVIDLVLSGDNAVVIGMAARSLSEENRGERSSFGGAGAIGLRIHLYRSGHRCSSVFPGLQAIGGVLLFWIAFKLLRPQGTDTTRSKKPVRLREAIQTIILADVVMSLDNILAVAGAAHGDIRLLIFGLLLSIPIILFGSELVARLLGRFPAFFYVGAFVLVHAAVAMILHDADASGSIPHRPLAGAGALVGDHGRLSLAIVRLLERTDGAARHQASPRQAPILTGRVRELGSGATGDDSCHGTMNPGTDLDVSQAESIAPAENDALSQSPWSAAHAPPSPSRTNPAAWPGSCTWSRSRKSVIGRKARIGEADSQ